MLLRAVLRSTSRFMRKELEMQNIIIDVEVWPLTTAFTIARGRKTQAEVLVIKIEADGQVGQGEAVPYRRYGETMQSARAALEACRPELRAGASRLDLLELLPCGAARNAVDCALWDLEAKQTRIPVWTRLGTPQPRPLLTAVTITLDTPSKMALAAVRAEAFPMLKIKLGGGDGIAADLERLAAIREVAPDKKLTVDVNEGWTHAELAANITALEAFKLMFIEQPIKAGDDTKLKTLNASTLAFAADESIHNTESLKNLATGYEWINIKLDKAGGLTEALRLIAQARAQNYQIMVGCMVATSLSMAPAHILAQQADFADLDGALWLKKDRVNGLASYQQVSDQKGFIDPPAPSFWGA